MLYRKKHFGGALIAIVIALATLVQANIKYTETAKIENRMKKISESVAMLIAENQAWTMRFEPEGGALQRMKNAKQEINNFLDEVGTTKKRREEILSILNQMIEHDIKQAEQKKK
jgi:hypothetical protein